MPVIYQSILLMSSSIDDFGRLDFEASDGSKVSIICAGDLDGPEAGGKSPSIPAMWQTFIAHKSESKPFFLLF